MRRVNVVLFLCVFMLIAYLYVRCDRLEKQTIVLTERVKIMLYLLNLDPPEGSVELGASDNQKPFYQTIQVFKVNSMPNNNNRREK
jgi:hypothetical protein